MEKTRFFFVVDKAPKMFPDGTILPPEVTAVFADSGGTECYAHAGQHGACDPAWIREHTVPAAPEQYMSLLSELRDLVGYDAEAVEVPGEFLLERSV